MVTEHLRHGVAPLYTSMGFYDRLLYMVVIYLLQLREKAMGKKDPMGFLDEILGPLIQPPKPVKKPKPKPVKKPK